MEEDKNLPINKMQFEELKKEIIQILKEYVDLQLKPVLNYFNKKKDFYEMNYL